MQKLLRLMAAACTALLVLGLAGSPADAADPALESQFVAGVNAVRAQAGLPPLAVHSQLTSVARSLGRPAGRRERHVAQPRA